MPGKLPPLLTLPPVFNAAGTDMNTLRTLVPNTGNAVTSVPEITAAIRAYSSPVTPLSEAISRTVEHLEERGMACSRRIISQLDK